MSGIPLTDEGVTSDGGAGETISLPPQNLHVPHPPKMLNVNLGEMQKKRKAFKWNALPIYVFTELLSLGWVLSIEL